MFLLLKLIQKNKLFLLLLACSVGVVAIIFNLFSGVQYEAHFNLVVKKINRLPTENYQYDDFYALQAVNMVSDTIQSWFKSRAILNEIDPLEKVELYVKKRASQNIEFTLRSSSKPYLLDTEKRIKDFLKENLEALLLNQEEDPTFTPSFLPSLITETKWKNWQLGLVGFITGFLIGVIYLILKEALKKDLKS